MLPEDYEKTFHSPGGILINRLEINEVIDLLEHPSKKIILDIGTGTGRVARNLLKRDNEVVGIDVSSRRLKLALEKIKREFKGKIVDYHLLLSDVHYLPFRSKVFDEIFSIRALKYLKNSNLGLFGIKRVIKNGGICLLEISNIFGYEVFWLFLLKLVNKKKSYAKNMGSNYHLFNVFNFKKTLKNLNLSVISTKSWHKLPTILFINCRDIIILKFLLCTESVLQKLFPIFLFSRGILVKSICEL